MSHTNRVHKTKTNDTIKELESNPGALIEKFKSGDSVTSRDIDAYVETVVERLTKVDSEQEAEKLFYDSVNFGEHEKAGVDDAVTTLEQNMKHGIVTDFAVEKFDDLWLENLNEEARLAKKKLEEASTDKFVLASEEDLDAGEERKKAEEEYMDARHGFDKVRQAVKEKLIEKLSLDPRLETWKKTGIHFFEKAVSNDKKHIKIVSGLDDKKRIVRDDRLLLGTIDSSRNADYSEVEKNNYRHAVELVKNLPPNKHIIDILAFDKKNAQQIVPFKKFIPLDKLVENEESGTPSASLRYVLDVIRGARYLEENGVGLQDIALGNISVVTDEKTGEKFGVLTDLEGLYPLNEKLNSRIVAAPPKQIDDRTVKVDIADQLNNMMGQKSPYFPTEASFEKKFQASETVFQFGVSLNLLQDELALNLKLMKSGPTGRAVAQEWKNFVERATIYEKDKKKPLEKRLTLQELETGLAIFVEKFQKMGL